MLAPLTDVLRTERQRTVPAYVSLPRYLGVLTLIFFGLQIATGILLMIYYRPSVAAAHYSTGAIMDEVRLGWLMRSLHRRGADLLMVLIGVHLIRVYVSRAYAGPRQLVWASGMLLLVVAVAFDLTGVLLPWDQHAYWSTDFLKETLAGVPFVGSALMTLLWGGAEIGEGALLRFYAFHIAVLPWIVLPVVAVHVLMVARTGLKPPDRSQPSDASRIPFFPDVVLEIFIALLLIFGALISLAMVFPARLGEQADPLSPLLQVAPRWYLMPAHELLHRTSGMVTVVLGLVLAVLVVVLPAIDTRPVESVQRKVVRIILGALVVAAWVLLGVKGYFF